MTPVKIRVSNKRAYIWEVDGLSQNSSTSSTFDTQPICRYRYLTVSVPNMRNSKRHLTSSIPTKLVFRPSPISHARRGRIAPRKQCVTVICICGHPIHFFTDLAVLVDDPKAHLPPTETQISEWKAQQRDSKLQQILLQQAKEADASVLSRSMSQDAIRKRQEREAKKRAAAALAPVDESLHMPLPTEPSKPAVPQYNVLIPATSSDLSWYSPDTCTYLTLDEAREAGIWDYPSSLHERAKCGVFRGLWDQGYFLGRGITFGGDYLVYPGMFALSCRFGTRAHGA